MIIHAADTSFLCALYRQQDNTPVAAQFRHAMTEPLAFTRLLEFEFFQAIELQVWLHGKDRTKGFPRRIAEKMITDWESDVAVGINTLVPCDMDSIFRLARRLSAQHTATGGHRTLDLLHVATAVHLRSTIFLSFDGRQQTLAREAGLKIPAAFVKDPE